MAKLLHIFYHKEGTFSLLCQQVQYFTLSKPTFQHGKYCIRFTLILGDGSTLNRQKGGFASAKEAMKYRDNLIVKLTQNQYMPYRFT